MLTVVNTTDLTGVSEASEAFSTIGARLVNVAPNWEAVRPELASATAYMAAAAVKVDRTFLNAAPNLRLVGSPNTGTDHLDLEEIKRRGIVCFDIARETDLLNSFTATSELAFALLLSLIRNLQPAIESAKRGDWARDRYSGLQLLGKTLGILGLGRLGQISARIGQGFGMRVIAHDVRGDAAAPGVEMVDFDRLLSESDVLSIHIHLRAETDGLIDAECFARMKPTAIVLNTSRGRIINEADLLAALKSGAIAGAGLDVIDGEWLPPAELRDHPLIAHARDNENLLIVPHLGGCTRESIFGARVFMARKMADWLQRHPNP